MKTSTKSPGASRLLTPASSSTGIATARSPGLMPAAMPCSSCPRATMPPAAISLLGTRPTTSAMLGNPSLGATCSSVVDRSAAVIGWPAGSALVVTTTTRLGSAAAGSALTVSSGEEVALRPMPNASIASSTASTSNRMAAMRIAFGMVRLLLLGECSGQRLPRSNCTTAVLLSDLPMLQPSRRPVPGRKGWASWS
ncbi:hypothetical protein D3C71_1116200 [compost metagenome]